MKIDHKESFGDFGEQFIKDKEIDGYFGSLELIKDIVYPFDLNEINNKIIAEIGVGSGRILKNLIIVIIICSIIILIIKLILSISHIFSFFY